MISFFFTKYLIEYIKFLVQITYYRINFSWNLNRIKMIYKILLRMNKIFINISSLY